MPLCWRASHDGALGLLAAGTIAHAFARGLAQTDSGKAFAVAARSADSARAFASEYGIQTAYGGYQGLLDDPNVDAVYISTPHNFHAEWAIKAAAAGKHILCEKPVTVSLAEALPVIAAARRAGVLFMEAFMYRTHPQLDVVREIVASGAIGEICFIEARHGFNAGAGYSHRTTSAALAGSGILDVGCYAMSFARLAAGLAEGKPFANPTVVKGIGHVSHGIDEWATASLQFESGVGAQVTTAVKVGLENGAVVYGSKGSVKVHSPWGGNGRVAGDTKLTLIQGRERSERIVPLDRGIYAREADVFAEAIDAGRPECAAMTPDDTLGNMAALDAWRADIGLRYAFEK